MPIRRHVKVRAEATEFDPAYEYLRKDQVFLLERYFYFLEQEKQHGLLVMDEVEKAEDRRFVRRLEAYYEARQGGE